MSICSNNGARDRRTFPIFCALSWLCIFVSFRGALWGASILVPLDIPAAMFSNYHFIDPTASSVPKNHALADMFDYDVPRTYLAHQALRAGEFPWWEPYTDGGRPLLAEAHTAITDPIRLLFYKALPFVPAYNWTRIVQSFLTGLGMFLLLRFLGFPAFVTILGALSFQFSGHQAVRFYPENVPSSLLWYPFLWMTLARFSEQRSLRAIALGGLLCGAILLSGNPQSHAYLILFLICYWVAYGLLDRGRILRTALACVATFIIGAALAAPILAPQVELYLVAVRERHVAAGLKQCLTGMVSLLSIFPWFSGTHRAIDPAKLVGANGAAFALYLGTPVMLLGVVALLNHRQAGLWRRPHLRMGVLLLATYLILICSTPLIEFLYLRSAGLGLLGICVLFGAGLELLLNAEAPGPRRQMKWLISILAAGVVGLHVFALFIFPRIEGWIQTFVAQRGASEPLGPAAPALRAFQIHNTPHEITFRNPELAIAFAAALLLPLLWSRRDALRKLAAAGMFLGNVIPLLLFFNRFTPNSPVAAWERLVAGGPEQKRAMAMLGRDLRLREDGTFAQQSIFPAATACFYKVHTLSSYTSFRLAGPGQGSADRPVNLVVAAGANATLTFGPLDRSMRRFIWADGQERAVEIIDETLDTIRLQIDPGPAGHLNRTDTYYPGWRVEKADGVRQFRDGSGSWAFSIPDSATELRLRYTPTGLSIWLASSAAAGALIVLLVFLSLGPRRGNAPHPARRSSRW
jgi:hypothetical protein